jgi:hypothetical protein
MPAVGTGSGDAAGCDAVGAGDEAPGGTVGVTGTGMSESQPARRTITMRRMKRHGRDEDRMA